MHEISYNVFYRLVCIPANEEKEGIIMKKAFMVVASLLLVANLSACGKSESVQEVENLISSIDTTVTLDSGDAIVSAESAYSALSEKEQKKVSNYDALTDARVQYDFCLAVDCYDSAVTAYNDTVGAYNDAATEANDANAALQAYLDGISDSGIYSASAYDQATIDTLQEATSAAVLSIQDNVVPLNKRDSYTRPDTSEMSNDEINELSANITSEAESISDEASDIDNQAAGILVPDYTDLEADIQVKWDAAQKSVSIQEQISQPSESFVIAKLYTIEEIDGVQAATEDNDPNGQLNKAKGYTAAVFFSVPTIDSNLLYGDSVLEHGTDGGGCIEVYTCVEDAENRNAYLSSFDGTVFSSGSHTVLGTMVIRTSNNLTATQQAELEAKIIEAMITLD